MGLFRRRAKGRHALGAAVTEIPSAPLAAPAGPAPLPPWEVAAPASPAVVVTPVAPEVVSETAELITAGQARRHAPAGPAAGEPQQAQVALSAESVPGVESPVVPAQPAPTTGVPAAPVVGTVPGQSSGGARDLLQAALADLSVLEDPAAAVADGAQPPQLDVVVPAPVAVHAVAPVLPPAPAAAEVGPQAGASARDLLGAALRDLSVLQTAELAAERPEVPAPRRVQLGFRDGTSTVLDPQSAQAQALEELAQSLTRKD